MKKSVIMLMLLTIISKISGFLRDLTLAYFYGASEISDIFLISLSIPTIIFGVIAAGISTGYIPLYSKIDNQFGEDSGIRFTNNLIGILMSICTVIVILALIFTGYLVKIFAFGFEGEVLELAVMFTRVSIFGIYFTIIIRILSAYLNYKQIFAVPSLIGIPMNLVLIVSIIISSSTGWIYLLAFANVLALFVQFLIIIFFACRHSFYVVPVFKPLDRHIKEMAALSLPVILGSSVTQINRLVDRSLASWVAVGGISSINYANTLNTSFIGIFVSSFVTVFYPDISKRAAKGDIDGLKYIMNQTIAGVMLLIIPATAGAMVFAEPTVRFLFARGAFDESAVSLTSSAFFFYSLGMSGSGINLILARTFFALQDTRTPMVNSAISMGINVVLSFTLAPVIGIGGIALATSTASIITALLLFKSLRKKLGQLHLKRMIPSFIKICAASAVSAVIAWIFYTLPGAGTSDPLLLAISILLMITIYSGLIYILKVEGADTFVKSIIRRFNKR